MSKNKFILESVIKECNLHLKRMDYAFRKLKLRFPYSTDNLSQLNDDEIALMDQLIYRFTKLQDAIGNKLFKCVLIMLDEEVANKSQIDIFNRLEQLEIISDYERWKSLRELRNELSHEYGENDNESAEKINLLFEKIPDLKNYLDEIMKYLNKRQFLQ
ncbi:MAG: HepT-like ribonuclease domain-containing protein [Melioribacter sp.]|uniref:HepT-like ribonuclease domain-containing protein n=1 Tax=Melioribacter sp. TaxID=2052167 RepID=UPI003BD11AF9